MNNFLQARRAGLLMLALSMAVLPLLMVNSFHYDIAIMIGINAIVCVGLNLLIGYAGQVSLGHAGFFALGAYASTILTDSYGWPSIVAMLAGALLVGVLSFIVARPILRLKGHYLAMGTLGMGIIISIILNQEVDLTGGPDGMPVPSFVIFGWEPYGNQVWYWIVAIALFISVVVALNIVESPIGRALRSLHGSELAAGTMGVDTLRFKVLIFVVSAVMASLAGSLFAHYSGFLTPTEGDFFRSIEFVTMVVLGGMASTFGAVIGAAILTILPQILAAFHDYEMMMHGLVLMGIMIFMRKGLVPTISGWLRRKPS